MGASGITLPSGVYSQKPCVLQRNVPPIYKCTRSELTLFRTTFSLKGVHKCMRTWWTLKQRESVYTSVQDACSWPSCSYKQLDVVRCLHSPIVYVDVFLSFSLPPSFCFSVWSGPGHPYPRCMYILLTMPACACFAFCLSCTTISPVYIYAPISVHT